jgi:hypothetical protein
LLKKAQQLTSHFGSDLKGFDFPNVFACLAAVEEEQRVHGGESEIALCS